MNPSLMNSKIHKHSRPILVTGAHRTGTTWVGKMLNASGETAYISEPFNLWHRRGVFRAKVKHWYTYLCEQNAANYTKAFQETLTFNYHLGLELLSLRSIKDFLRMNRDGLIFLRGKLSRQRPLLKDPFAVFSIPWLINQHNFQVVVTIRHPAAFVSSLKRLDWTFDFRHLLQQPLLMTDRLGAYKQQMIALLQDPPNVIAQGSLLWQMVYDTVNAYHQEYPEIQLVRHEDLAFLPVEGYSQLYQSLGLQFSPAVEKTIKHSSSSENPSELNRKKVHSVRLDSRASLENWKRRLTAQEINDIRKSTEELASYYYPEITWDNQ